MPLNATFLADFSSFLDATTKAIQATANLEAAAGKVGPAYDTAVRQSAAANEEAAKATDKMQESAREFGAKIGEHLKDLAKETIEFGKTYVDAFAESQQATERLTKALENAGAAEGTVKTYEALAESLAKVSTFSKDRLIDIQTLLTSVGNIKPDMMQQTLQAVMDLAAGMAGSGMSLEAAAKLVAKAAASDGESLGKLKMILGDAYEKGAGFDKVLEAINTKFGGQAAADLKTYAGQMENLKNQMHELDEQVGAVIVPTLSKMLELFNALPDSVKTFSIGLVAIGTALAPVLISLSSLASLLSSAGLGATIAAFAGTVAGTLVSVFEGLMAAIGPVGWVILGLTAVGAAIWHWRDDIIAALKKLWEDEKTYTARVAEEFKTIGTAVAEVYAGVKTWLYDKLSALFTQISSIVKDLTANVGDAFHALYMRLVGGSIVPDMIHGIAQQFGMLGTVMVDPAKAAAAGVTSAFSSMTWPGATGIPWPGATGMGQSVASQFVRFPLMFGGATSGLTETPLGSVVTINMQGLLMTDDPGARAQLRDAISDALMPAMRGTRLLGTT